MQMSQDSGRCLVPQPPVGPLLQASSPLEAPAAPRSSALRPSRFSPSTASLPPQVILGTQSLRGPRRNFSLGRGEGGTQASCPYRPLPGSQGGRRGRGIPQGPALGEAGWSEEHSWGWGWGRAGNPKRPRGVSGKPEPGNCALPSHLLHEGPRGSRLSPSAGHFPPQHQLQTQAPHTAQWNRAHHSRRPHSGHTE